MQSGKGPSGVNVSKKVELLMGEGVEIDGQGMLRAAEKVLWGDFVIDEDGDGK